MHIGPHTGHSARRPLVAVVALLAAIGMLTAGSAHAAPKSRTAMHAISTGTALDKTWATLARTTDRVSTTVHTVDRAGHAYTLWYVIFNKPLMCSGGICNEDDVFAEGGGFNVPQIEAAEISVVSAGLGRVANKAGRLQLHGGLDVGEVPAGPRRVVIGRAADGALVGVSPVTGLVDAIGAEIHLVLQDHGMAHKDRARRNAQRSQFEGACNPECDDTQFAVFTP